jgi:hypothetical protein
LIFVSCRLAVVVSTMDSIAVVAVTAGVYRLATSIALVSGSVGLRERSE